MTFENHWPEDLLLATSSTNLAWLCVQLNKVRSHQVDPFQESGVVTLAPWRGDVGANPPDAARYGEWCVVFRVQGSGFRVRVHGFPRG